MRVLITGGAGFIGSSLALALAARHPGWEVVASDNLYRRGSELNLSRLRAGGVDFVHADVRVAEDLGRLSGIDALVECSAEPSVMADAGGGGRFVVDTNLMGAFNCLELAAREEAQFVFLSTSRVYPVRGLEALRYEEGPTRFELTDDQPMPGASREGVAESFPLAGSRTLYGATKLAGELLVEEYVASRGLRAVVDRCGVIAGPWQMGKVDQGVFTHWMLSFILERPLSYIGYGGTGRQVRDLLHVDDLVDLVERQLEAPDDWAGRTFNVGGGRDRSLSLQEATDLARELTGSEMEVGSVPEERRGDVPVYLSDCRALYRHTDWRPARSARDVMVDIHGWITTHQDLVRSTLN